MKLTIYEIAKEAGISASTVSRVINGNERVKKETREKVIEILNKYNFTPDQTARGLASGFSKLVGIAIEDIRNGHHNSIAFDIENKLRENGYFGIIVNTTANLNLITECVEGLINRNVEGIVFLGSLYQDSNIMEMLKCKFSKKPILLVNGEYVADNLWSLIINEFDGVGKCVELLFNQGKKNIAYIQKPTTASGFRKKEGFIQKMVQLGFKKDELCIINAQPNIEAGFDATIQAFSIKKNINGIIYSEDLLAVGGLKALNMLQKSVPNDVAIIGIDDSIYSEITTPRITTLNPCLNILGEKSANILMDILKGKTPPKYTIIETNIVIKETTK
ncbi:hypothetical protein AN640_08690 [Candidatus Epulonipiscium fishelsonii]|uniref:Uncharacterized protein n=1 Tax=Candidatus Epulonipiscium fishelsonii TaxID=77094 RepID=A0ACC8XCX6_9FIRM|nr:hypothetical protein AN640_08690 [Epulopiscium sp. SCG-D08WGA-EpuloA1]OON90361.1 MAG: hypothetical protein ATN32_04125 [Epulopiscium sp. AS2M-Bin002]